MKLNRILCFLALCFSCQSFIILADGVSNWEGSPENDCADIWNGEHLDDILCNNEGVVVRNVVLLVYGPQCRKLAGEIWEGLLDVPLPRAQHLTVLRHDHMSAPINTWFNYTKSYNLTKRLGIKDCLKTFFFKQGTQFKDYVKYPSDHYQDLVKWIWKHLEINIYIYNEMPKPVHLSLEGYIPSDTDEFSLEANGEMFVKTYISNVMLLYSMGTEEFLDGFELHNNVNVKATDKSKYKGKEEIWRIKSHFEHRESEETVKLFLCSHNRRHFNMLTQPKSVPNFTKMGYHLTKIPAHIHEMLLTIYEENREQLSDEYYPNYFTVWNLDEVTMKQVTLSEGKALYLSEELQPILEAWCHCSLQQTKGEGIATRIRQYSNGSRVRMHVDEVESGHVIGAILQVTQDLTIGDSSLWPLEVIDFKGQRQQIHMKPGEMVLFESSRLVHGRPSVLHAQYYVNAFFYFTPPHGWNVYPKGNLRGVPMAQYFDTSTVPTSSTETPVKGKTEQRQLGHADEL